MTPRKPADLALLLVCTGAGLLMPPLVWIFNKPLTTLGVPLAALCVFGVWLVLIIGAIALARMLPRNG